MQKNFHEQYVELIADVQTFLSEEFPKKEVIYAQPSFIQDILHSRSSALNTVVVQAPAKKVSIPVYEPPSPIDDFNVFVPPVSPQGRNLAEHPQQRDEESHKMVQEAPKKPVQLKSQHLSDESKAKVKPSNSSSAEKPQKKNKISEGVSNSSFINLEYLESPPPLDFMPFKAALKEHFPQIKIIEEIPDDSIAKALSQKWKQKVNFSPIIIFNLNESSSSSAFLNNIAKSLNIVFGQGQEQVAMVISPVEIQEMMGWEAFFKYPHRLIISKDIDVIVSQLPELKNFYKESSKSGKFYLGTIPLILLSDFSFYLKDFTLKKSLWNSICTYLRSKNLS